MKAGNKIYPYNYSVENEWMDSEETYQLELEALWAILDNMTIDERLDYLEKLGRSYKETAATQ